MQQACHYPVTSLLKKSKMLWPKGFFFTRSAKWLEWPKDPSETADICRIARRRGKQAKCNLVRLPSLHIQRFGAYIIAWRGRTFDRAILHKAMRVNPKTRIAAYNKSSPKGCTASQIFSCSCPLMMSDDRRFIQMSGAQCRWGSSAKMWAEWGVKLGGSRRHIQLHLMSVPSQ